MIFQNILRKFGYTLYNNAFHNSRYILKREFQPLEQLFWRAYHNDFFFLQIGANDGIRYDPIHDLVVASRAHGIALEPLPDLFEQLRETYRDMPEVQVLNYAIHRDKNRMPLYRTDPDREDLPAWAMGIASFNKDHHKISGIDPDCILEEWVDCLSLNQLLDNYRIKKVDLLQIDTEGYDYEILQMLDFHRIKPAIISFEHGLKDGIMSREQYNECSEILFSQGYKQITLERDAIAYQ